MARISVKRQTSRWRFVCAVLRAGGGARLLELQGRKVGWSPAPQTAICSSGRSSSARWLAAVLLKTVCNSLAPRCFFFGDAPLGKDSHFEALHVLP
jgi:hypothetical protein